jgi:hypothetical protein
VALTLTADPDVGHAIAATLKRIQHTVYYATLRYPFGGGEQRRRHGEAEDAGISALMTNSNFVACMTGRNEIFGGKIFDPRQLFLVDHASHIGQDAPNPLISPGPPVAAKP